MAKDKDSMTVKPTNPPTALDICALRVICNRGSLPGGRQERLRTARLARLGLIVPDTEGRRVWFLTAAGLAALTASEVTV